MKDKKLTYRTLPLEFERVTARKDRTIQQVGQNTFYRLSDKAQETFTKRKAGFVIEIDIADIIDDIVHRAMSTKALKSQLLGKRIRCRAENVQALEQRVVDYPVREGYEVVT